MKKLFTLLLLTILPVFAMAEGDSPVVIDGISYKFAENVLEAEVVSNESSKYTGDVIIPSSVLYEGKEYEASFPLRRDHRPVFGCVFGWMSSVALVAASMMAPYLSRL